jgi:hypothetical protein
MTVEPNYAGKAFETLVAEQLTEERARKTSLEAKGAAILTTTAALVGLLFGFTTLVAGQTLKGADLQGARDLLWYALLALLVAAGCGLAVNFPWPYREVVPAAMRDMIDHWTDDPIDGEKRAARARTRIYESARHVDGIKALVVFAGTAFEVVGVVLLAFAVRSVVF